MALTKQPSWLVSYFNSNIFINVFRTFLKVSQCQMLEILPFINVSSNGFGGLAPRDLILHLITVLHTTHTTYHITCRDDALFP